MILADHFGDGNFLEIWRRLSHPHPVLSLRGPELSGSGPKCFRASVESHYASPAEVFLGHDAEGRRRIGGALDKVLRRQQVAHVAIAAVDVAEQVVVPLIVGQRDRT